MNRRHFITQLGATGIATTIASPSQGAEAAAKADAPVLRDAPAVYAPTPDGATVIWPVTGHSAGWVEYGEQGSPAPGRMARADGFGFVPHDPRVLRVRLTGLKPGASYWFKTHTRPVPAKALPASALQATVSRTYALRVPDPAAAETRFCIWNDTHDRGPTLAKLGELTRAEPADFLFWNGDVSNNINDEAILAGLYVQPRGDVNLADGPPILMSRGNHDVRGTLANRVSAYVDFPGGRPYYSFRSGPVAAIVLDTGEDKPDHHPSFLGLVNCEELIREQTRWLAAEIEKPHLKSAPYRLVFCHIPLRWKDEFVPTYDAAGSSFDHWSGRGRAAWHDALVRWGAQLVISGHTHDWHHMKATREFPYEQLVGGGPAFDETRGQAILIKARADAQALTFRLVNAFANREVFRTSLGPLA